MEQHLLDSFAAHSVGTTLDDFTRRQRVPADRVRRPPARRHRATLAVSTTLGVAAPTLTALALVTR
ncbi:hypothetical protein [Georgenia satyanarayanai]|uniref:hypothetical protein n=1 Tax=Georgenia satyanarayanai TaxID=860221 RepID=UPI00126518B1|nr:hypothetical protein [Georgenia satyanarayanai]